ncbi:zinc-ribbon domain containing protein [Variovorax paradoxus]|jgi:hypothetical protein|uniref:zinc-ribbon domain containing protein n=1 Tax=Variovorax paradoxus TaxID=34073 RepID=UPI0029C70C52|nr:zinc-ribbon domain containing protein [Variovorax paradoxus]
MKSNKQRRAEIRAHRLERAARLEAQMRVSAQRSTSLRAPGLAAADVGVLERHNNTVGPLPTYYVDRAFTCRDCGAEEVWTAKQQKWWHEVAHGSIESRAAYCLACRRARRAMHAASQGEGANRLGEMSERLRVLARSAPTPEAREEVDAALESKWWGLRVLAVAALGCWGTAADIARLRAWADVHPPSWGTWEQKRGSAAVEALGGCLRHPGDDAWALEACLQGHANPWSWRVFLREVPAERMEACVKAEFASQEDDPQRLLRLLALLYWIGQSPGLSQVAVLHTHPHAEVRLWAKRFQSPKP